MRLLRWLPSRRVELLLTLLFVLGMLGLAAFLRAQFVDQAAKLLILITLEIILPLGMGLISASLLAGDPVLDILLSAFRPAWLALVERLLFTGGVGILVSSAVMLVAARWNLPLPKDGSAQLYIWLSPLVFYMGLGSAVSLLRGSILDGTLAVLGFMGVSLVSLAQIPQLCSAVPAGAGCIWWLASPMMTLGNSTDAYWPLNRIVWLFLGLGLLALSLRLARREEPLLHEVSSE